MENDLFGEPVARKRANNRPESAALKEVLMTLRSHSMVAWCERMNSGAAMIGGRYVRFGFTGCPDVLGQLKDGRLLGVECKAAKGRLSGEQDVFLERVRSHGGVAFVARDCRDVMRELSAIGGV